MRQQHSFRIPDARSNLPEFGYMVRHGFGFYALQRFVIFADELSPAGNGDAHRNLVPSHVLQRSCRKVRNQVRDNCISAAGNFSSRLLAGWESWATAESESFSAAAMRSRKG